MRNLCWLVANSCIFFFVMDCIRTRARVQVGHGKLNVSQAFLDKTTEKKLVEMTTNHQKRQQQEKIVIMLTRFKRQWLMDQAIFKSDMILKWRSGMFGLKYA